MENLSFPIVLVLGIAIFVAVLVVVLLVVALNYGSPEDDS